MRLALKTKSESRLLQKIQDRQVRRVKPNTVRLNPARPCEKLTEVKQFVNTNCETECESFEPPIIQDSGLDYYKINTKVLSKGEDLGEGYARRVETNVSTTLTPSPSPQRGERELLRGIAGFT